MPCVRFGSVFFILIMLGLLAGSTPNQSFAQEPGEFQFEANQRSGTSLHEAKIEKGLPEGFDSSELVAGIGGDSLANALTGWFSFGDARSRSVTVLLTDETPRRLFVDLNRDRVLESSELISPSTDEPNSWIVDLDAEFVRPEAEPIHQQQQVRIGFKPDEEQLILSASGSMIGTVEFAGEQRMARYVDRDSNGRWFDADDRLFVDLNGDGNLDPLLERLPCQGMRQIDGKLYAISGDDAGRRLTIEAVHDRGSIVPVVKLNDPSAKVISVDASIASNSGMQIRVLAIDEPVEVPVGSWHVANLRITVQGESGTYSFVFENLNPKANPQLVEKDGSFDIELLGTMRITATTSNLQKPEGATRIVTPLLKTGSGLYLANARSGKVEASNENRLVARSLSLGSQFHIGSTGFT